MAIHIALIFEFTMCNKSKLIQLVKYKLIKYTPHSN
jgi:hypothetical protein